MPLAFVLPEDVVELPSSVSLAEEAVAVFSANVPFPLAKVAEDESLSSVREYEQVSSLSATMSPIEPALAISYNATPTLPIGEFSAPSSFTKSHWNLTERFPRSTYFAENSIFVVSAETTKAESVAF